MKMITISPSQLQIRAKHKKYSQTNGKYQEHNIMLLLHVKIIFLKPPVFIRLNDVKYDRQLNKTVFCMSFTISSVLDLKQRSSSDLPAHILLF